MYLYLIVIFFFLLANYLMGILIKKYTFKKFFTFLITYFILVNFINLAYLKNINFFTFQVLFSVFMLFLYAGLHRSVSVKIMIYLYLKKNNISVNNFYKTEFKEKSFNKRIKILTDNGFLIKKNKNFFLSSRGKKYLEIIKIIHAIYGIKSSG